MLGTAPVAAFRPLRALLPPAPMPLMAGCHSDNLGKPRYEGSRLVNREHVFADGGFAGRDSTPLYYIAGSIRGMVP